MRQGRTYGRTSIALHWIIGLAIIGMIPFGLYLEEVPEGPAKLRVFAIHAGIGLTVLALATVRIGRRLQLGFAPPIPTHASWERALARPVQWALLVGTILAPLSGFLFALGKGYPISYFGLVQLIRIAPSDALETIGHAVHGPVIVLGLGSLVILHVIGALKHHLLDKDATLRRMLGRPERVVTGRVAATEPGD